MKRSAGLVIIASLLFLLGLTALSSDVEAGYVVNGIRLAIGLTSVVAAYALWSKRAYAIKAYWVWVATCLVGGGVSQFIQGGALYEVAIWWVMAAAVWVLMGVYLKGTLKKR